jgi:hypothetical protein
MLATAEQDPARLKACLADRWWRLNNLYWIKDKWGNKVRFKPNVVQQRLDDDLHYLNLCLKSRQHGVTTWACIRALDMILFRRNCQTGIVAHTAFDAAKFFRQKVLFAYDNLPDWLKRQRPAVRRDMKDGILELSNGSSIEVSVSHRGGTLQFLHISEYGPMCSLFPQRAAEVASGALNTVAIGNIVVIESTAHGAIGDFYERSKLAQELDRQIRAGTAKLTEMDYKFHFFGWFDDPQSRMDPTGVPISPEMVKYFDKLEDELDVALTAGQRAWYVKKAIDQREHMRREFPSTPKEAFEASVEGAYYGPLMQQAEIDGRLGAFPHRPGVPVHTFWDIGRRDATAIWFMQENGAWYDFIAYYEASGEQSAHFAKVLQQYQAERNYVYGKHYMPHDIEVTEWVGTGDNKTRKEVLEEGGVKPINVVPRIANELEGIDMVRRVLYRCRFDLVLCGPPVPGGPRRGGIDALRNFRKEWNEQTATFKDTPHKDWTNHGADAFRQMAQAFGPTRPKSADKEREEQGSWKTQ